VVRVGEEDLAGEQVTGGTSLACSGSAVRLRGPPPSLDLWWAVYVTVQHEISPAAGRPILYTDIMDLRAACLLP